MLQKPKGCIGCTLYYDSKGFSNPEGRCSNGVLIIGESLGSNEVMDALPFRPYAEAGSALQTVFRVLGYERTNFGLWNMIGCVSWDTKVLLPNNTKEAISELVRDGYNGEVVSFDSLSNKFTNKKVTKVYKTLRSKRKLYRISYDGAKNHSRGLIGTTATEEHLFLTDEGWIRADNLNGKNLNIGAENFGNRANSVIIGTLLGDSHISENCGTLTNSHCEEQREWSTLKAKVLGTTSTNRNNSHFIHTKACARMREYQKEFYWNGKKSLPNYIASLLSPQAVATWYMDDGSISTTRWNKRSKKVKRANPLAEIATCHFTESEVERLILGLKKFNLDAYGYHDSNLYWRIKFTVAGTKSLVKLISKFVPPIMRYKLGNIECDGFDPSLWEFEGMHPMFAKAIVKRITPNKKQHKFVYCLDVEDTHNFITLAGVTHNCQPPYNILENTSYEYEAIEHCREAHFNRIMQRFKPKVILALGNVPLKHLWKKDSKVQDYIDSLPEDTKEEKKFKKNYMKNFQIGSMRGYLLPSVFGIPMIASFHPSHINYEKGRPLLGVLMQDLTQALTVARNGIPKFQANYIHNPTEFQLKQFLRFCKNNPQLAISHDIETPYTTLELDESEIEFENQEVRDIDSIQFSIKEGEGIFVNWNDNNIPFIRDILSLSNPKIGWNNWKFDEININYHLGLEAINGEIHDIMWMWKWLNQDFVKTGRALQFATNFAAPGFPVWKHLSHIEKEQYGCLDVDATLRIFNYLKDVLSKMRLDKDSKSLYEGYMDDIVKLRPILKDMTRRGFPINPEERERFVKVLEAEQEKTLAELQEEYPTELRVLDPINGYKFIPQEVINIELLFEQAKDINNNGPYHIVEDEEVYKLRLANYIERHTRKPGMTGLLVREFDVEGFKVKRYCRMKEFKPGSPPQVLKYLEFRGYKIPKKRIKGRGEVDTTDKTHLQPLWEETGDDLLYKCIYMRELDNLKSTFVDGQLLRSDNRVEAEFLPIPATGQLSTSPNIQNYAARGTKFSSKNYEQLANGLRKTVQAKAGHTLISADWSAFHINTLSYEANDPEYMRIGRIDPHSFLTAHMLASDLPNSLPKLKKNKPSGDADDIGKWMKEIETGEEALVLLKDLDTWMQLSDESLTDKLRWIKKYFSFIRNAQAKRALLGMGFGMGFKRFYRENRYVFNNQSEPERILKKIKKLWPKTFVHYHEYIKNLADKQTYLLTRYGYIRRFFDVYDWRLLKGPKSAKEGELIIKNAKGQWWQRRDGSSAKEAIAYNPANDAFGVKKESMRNFWNHPNGNLIKAFGLINEIHDDLMWETENSLVGEATKIIKEVMESPAQFLKSELCPNGLVTRIEIKLGKNWAPFNDKLEKGPINLDGMKEIKL